MTFRVGQRVLFWHPGDAHWYRLHGREAVVAKISPGRTHTLDFGADDPRLDCRAGSGRRSFLNVGSHAIMPACYGAAGEKRAIREENDNT